jgi:cephalosporin-C deacetylase-like acetyl esterase
VGVAQSLNPQEQKQNTIDSLPETSVSFESAPENKNAIFRSNEKIVYNVKVNNPGEPESGKLSYIISTTSEKELNRGAIDINLRQHATENYTLTMPAQNTGFYKVKIIINVADYDDTIRRVFGVNPKEIRSATKRPDDFERFWDDTKKELSKVAPDFKITRKPELEKDNTIVYLVEARSLNNIKIRGWLSIPKNRKPKEKLPVWILFPGYGGAGLKPFYGSPDIAALCWNVRGEGNSRDVVHPAREEYVTMDIENKNRYIYRGVLMDCIRAVDFVVSRPDLDAANIMCEGSSAGGYLSLATASLDKRVKLCSSNNPVYCDFRSLQGSNSFPMSDIESYARGKYIRLDRIFNTLDYFDLKNFAPDLKCKTVIGISFLDNLAPPYNEYVMINNIKPRYYKLFVYPLLGHEVPPSLGGYLSRWMMDEFDLY